jgi:hypothetical protein
MQSNDPYILAAMDGQEHVPSPAPTSAVPPKRRSEATAFFFILFGLVYDALATASTDATAGAASRETAIIALEALKSLVRPEYSGKAMLEPTIFEEFCSLCYRMAVTESAVVQIHLVEAIAELAKSQPAETLVRL